MEQPWREYVRLGIVQFMAFPELAQGEGPAAQRAAELLKDGFFQILEVAPVNDARERARLREAAKNRAAGLALACQPLILSGNLNLNSLDPEERTNAVAALKEAIVQARELDAEGLAIMSGPAVAAAERPRAVEGLVKSLVEICRAAGDLPVHMEVFDEDVDKKRLLGPTRLAAEVARRVRRKHANFGLMLDLSHFPLQHEEPQDALNAARDVLTHVHVGNCIIRNARHPGYGDSHPRFGIPEGETGVDELAEFLKLLKETGYLIKGSPRIVSIEVKPLKGESSADTLGFIRQAWREAWAKAAPVFGGTRPS